MIATRRLTLPVARTLLATSVLLLVGAVVQPAVAGEDDEAPVVAVGADGGEAYAPAEVLVEPGEPVTFVWEDLGHSVTHDADDPAFDTHPDCRQTQVLDVPRDCGRPGTSEEVVLDEPGVYDFGCHLHDEMTGTITVETADATSSDAPDEEGSSARDEDDTDPSDEGGADGSDANQGGANQGGASEGGANGGADGAEPSEGGDGSEPSTDGSDRDDAERQQAADALADFSPQRAPAADIGEAPVPDEGLRSPGDAGDGAGVQEPEVDEPGGFAALRDDSLQAGARPGGDGPDTDPDLEPFPEEPELGTDDEVALPTQEGGDRTVPIALASLGVLGTGAAVLRQVLVTA